ncbi:MAG TPA: S8 family serine peptidase [Polyangiales bacterium]|nr:S8 family serine peptidase [Polyangiales bacterium]
MKTRRCLLHWVLSCTSLLPSLASAQLEPGSPTTHETDVAEVDPRVERALANEDRAGVFLMLRESEASTAAAQQAVIARLGSDFEVSHRYGSIRALAGSLTRAGLATVRGLADVAAIQIDGQGSGGLAQALPAVGIDKVHDERGLTGKGITVAILDSGAPTMHPALQDAIVAQHCFTTGGCPPLNQNQGDSAEDDHNHGSNVTGIVASRGGGGIAKGYAPGASIVAVKVLNRQNGGRVSDWVAGFDWVSTNLSMLNVKVINASLVSTEEYASAADCDRGEPALSAVTKKLIEAGVTITASSGNTGHIETMTAPACNTGVIAVGATYDSDLGPQPETGGTYQALGGGNWPACSDAQTDAKTIACFTSTAGSRLDVLAPGSQLTSTGKGTGMSMFRGTSQAAPGVAGLAALLLECNPALTPSSILDVLKQTGEMIMDPRNGLSYPLIRGVQAVEMACPNMPGMPAMPTAGAGAPTGGGAPPAAGSGGIVAPTAGSSGTPAAGSGGLVPANPGITAPTPTAAPGSLAGSPASTSSTAGDGAGALGTAGNGARIRVPSLTLQDDSGCQIGGTVGGASSSTATPAWLLLSAFGLLSSFNKGRRWRRRVRTR